MNNDNNRNAGSIWDICSIGSDYHDIHYIPSSDTDSEENRTESSSTVANSNSRRWNDYVYNFFIERASDAFSLSPPRLLSEQFFKRTIK